MLRRLFLCLVALVLLWAISVGLIGWRTQHNIEQGLAHFNTRISAIMGSDLSRANAHVHLEHYDRGWLTSTVRYQVELTDRQGDIQHYYLDDHIEHGPFPISMLRQGQFQPVLARSTARLEATPDMLDWLAPQANQDTPMVMTTHIGFSGKSESLLRFAPLHSPDGVSPQIRFSGGEARLEVSNQFRTSQLVGHIDSYQQIDDTTQEVVTLDGIDMDAHTSQLDGERGLDHHGQMLIHSLKITQGEDIPTLQLHEVQTSLGVSQRNPLMDIGLQYRVGQLDVGGAGLGQITLGMAVNRLDRDALVPLQVAWRKHADKLVQSGAAGLTKSEQQELASTLQAVLRHQPEWRLDPVIWQNEAGQSHASASVGLADGFDPDSDPDDWLLASIQQADLQISLNRPMMVALFEALAATESDTSGQATQLANELFDAYAESFRRLGLVTRVDDDVQLNIRVLPGENHVLLNDSEMTLEQLMLLGVGLLLQL